MLQEAIFYGSTRPRQLALMGVASNYTVEGDKLLPKLRTPFRQAAKRGECSEWWAGLDSLRYAARSARGYSG